MANRKKSKPRPGKKPATTGTARRSPVPPTTRTAPASTAATYSLKSQAVESKPTTMEAAATAKAIQEAAYFLWRKRGGNEVVNWLEAERMVLASGSEKRKTR
jgi:hypothetical protein